MALDLGINLAFYDYGADFAPKLIGRGPPTWRLKVEPKWSPGSTTPHAPGSVPTENDCASDPKDTKLFQDLTFLKSIGVTVVRWMLLGEGLILTGDGLPTKDPVSIPDKMHSDWTADFNFALEVFRAAEIQMMPILIDHLFATKPKIIFNGRNYDVPFALFRDFNKGGKVDPEGIKAFVKELQNVTKMDASSWISKDPTIMLQGGRSDWLIDLTLRPRLIRLFDSIIKSTNDSVGVIRAWEIISEPDLACTDHNPRGDIYVLAGPDGYGYKRLPIQRQQEGGSFSEAEALDTFLAQCIDQLATSNPEHSFTIGFHNAHALAARFAGKWGDTYRKHARDGSFIPAFHYYPENLYYVAPRIWAALNMSSAGTSDYLMSLASLTEVLKDPLKDAKRLIIQEFATTDDYQGMQKQVWPDINGEVLWGGPALLKRLQTIEAQFGRLGPSITLMPWAYASIGDRAGFTLRHAAAMAEYSGRGFQAVALKALAPDDPDPPLSTR